MKITLLSVFAAVMLIAAAAHAESEGNGDPFAFRAPGVVTVTGLASLGSVASAQPAYERRPRSSAEIAQAPAFRTSNR